MSEFCEPAADARYLIQESGQKLSYGEMTADIDPELRPQNEGEYQTLLDTLGAVELD